MSARGMIGANQTTKWFRIPAALLYAAKSRA